MLYTVLRLEAWIECWTKWFAGAMPPTLAVKMAVVVVAVIPAVLVYPFVQRHFTTGVMLGAVKG